MNKNFHTIEGLKDAQTDISEAIKLIKCYENHIDELEDKIEELKAKFEKNFKYTKTLEETNEELERIILESGIQPQCKADKQWPMK